MKKSMVGMAVFFGLIAGSCTKTEGPAGPNLTFKQAIENNVNKVNNALDAISQTQGYRLLSVNSGSLKSEEIITDSITLKLISGIYTYKPDNAHLIGPFSTYKLFIKTGASDSMIINLPQKLIFHPVYFRNIIPADSALKNDFNITATDYHYYYTGGYQYDYKLSAGFRLDTANLGNLDVIDNASQASGETWSSKYSFTGGYSINVSGQTGDTTVSAFSLSNSAGSLLKETVSFVRTGIRMTERQYVLSIGNIDIKRSSTIDSIQVYLNGVLQKKAGVKIKESTDSSGSITQSRDIQLTFDDGTTTNLSTLLAPAMTALKTIVSSLQSMYISTNIVNYLAISIYYNSR
jgi:hypothetical protein